MSVTYSLYCQDCDTDYWIGQQGAGSDKPWIYKEPIGLVTLQHFLVAHEGHVLRFLSDFAIEALRQPRLDEEWNDIADRQLGG